MCAQPVSNAAPEDRGHSRHTLLVRASVARTFGSLASFLAIVFLGVGIYLLRESLSDPLTAQSVGLIAGAFIVALATMLIYFMCAPRARFRSGRMRRRSHARESQRYTLVAERPAASGEERSKDLVAAG